MIELVTKQHLKQDLQQLLLFLKIYLLDPITNIKKIPPLHWQSGLLFIFLLNIIFGLLRAVFSGSILNAIVGFFITPILAVILISLTTLFLGYFFTFVLEKRISYQKIFNILLLSYIPGSLFFLGSIFYAPLFILGVVVTSSLLVIGLVENLQIPKKMGIRLVVIGGSVVLLFWLAQQFFIESQHNQIKTLDQLEKEIESLSPPTH